MHRAVEDLVIAIPRRYRSMNGAWGGHKEWLAALRHALPISAFVLAIYYYWFGIADRYHVFLYYHDMGPLF
ncbi:MAG: hypothetical protein R6X16_06800, partial [Anaerolineae bacterium]